MHIRMLDPNAPLEADVVALAAAVDHEVSPTDPLPGPLELSGWLFGDPPLKPHITWVAHLDAAPVGLVQAEIWTIESHRHIGDIHTYVRPELRRRGIGRRLAATAIGHLAPTGRTSIMGFTATPAGTAFSRHLGMTERLQERCSRLRLADLDPEQQQRWIDEGQANRDGYRLVQWQGTTPSELVDLVCAAQSAMADAPTDDLDFEEVLLDPERLATRDGYWSQRGCRNIGSIVVAADGSPAGFTEAQVYGERPQLVHQGDTGVLAAHRGHGLGRWLKAANLRQVMQAEPRAEVVETHNAESNPWMLDINVAMGFRPHITYTAFQADTTTLQQNTVGVLA